MKTKFLFGCQYDVFSLSNESLYTFAISFVAIAAVLFTLRIYTQVRAQQALKEELAQRDNFALN